MKKTRTYTKHTPATDTIIYAGMERRGSNSQTAAANKLRQTIFKKMDIKMTTSSIINRYYYLRKAQEVEVKQDSTPDLRQTVVNMLMTKNVTIEIRGKEITAVFK
tara:strand:+ start:72 stop:386 length:315 start_codon:yes stop_codon:yes gene_type:complete